MDYATRSLEEHRRLRGKLTIHSKVELNSRDDLSTYYTPGIAAVSQAIAENPASVWDYTWRSNLVAVVSDGSAVLGLGNIGAEAAQPVMAGKAILFKEFADIDAIPIVLGTQDTATLITTIRALAPTFGGINLEDIAAPRCFEIEAALQDLGIPVMHDDQHGTAVVVLAGLLNALKVTGQKLAKCEVVINGAGAAGVAIATMLHRYSGGTCNVTLVDSKGIISESRNDLNPGKRALLTFTNQQDRSGDLAAAIQGANIFIGVSRAGALPAELVSQMVSQPIIFALANPTPEIMPDVAHAAGAAIVATGRSDFPNQVNNVLAFPGIFRGALDAQAVRITPEMLTAAAEALAGCITPSAESILPDPLDRNVASTVARAVAEMARGQGVVRPAHC